jgi:hypothetical protein
VLSERARVKPARVPARSTRTEGFIHSEESVLLLDLRGSEVGAAGAGVTQQQKRTYSKGAADIYTSIYICIYIERSFIDNQEVTEGRVRERERKGERASRDQK